MDKLVAQVCEIFEVTELPLEGRFTDIPSWDSLNALSVIALFEGDYGVPVTAAELEECENISQFLLSVLARSRQ